METAAHATYPSGIRVADTRIPTVAVPSGPGRAAASGRGTGAVGRETRRGTTYDNPAFIIRSVTFGASSVDGSTAGACKSVSGVRAGLAGTPLATGYSNESPFSSTSCPVVPVTNRRNCWACCAFLLDLSTPPPDRLTNAPGSWLRK